MGLNASGRLVAVLEKENVRHGGGKRSLKADSSIFLCALLKALRSGCSGPDNFSIKRK